jgi:phosphate starvation-inducible protein PhoH
MNTKKAKPNTTSVNKVQKTEIKYNIQFTEEQKRVKEGVYRKAISFINGTWGTGKTNCAVQIGLDLLFKKDNPIDKMYISRPVDYGPTGYLKGSMEEKMAFHIFPLKQSLYASYGKDRIDKLFQDGTIQTFPIDYMKGMTAANAVMIIDEYEDIVLEDFEMITSRLGKGSKLIFTGDINQSKIKKDSCINKVKHSFGTDYVSANTLTENFREPEAAALLDFLKTVNDK